MSQEQNLDGLVLATNIRRRRKKLGLTQKELASPPYSLSYIRAVEQGKVACSPEFLTYLTARLKISLEDLLYPPGGSPMRVLERAFEDRLAKARAELRGGRPRECLNILGGVELEEVPLSHLPRYLTARGEASLALNHYQEARGDLEEALNLYLGDPDSDPLNREIVRFMLGALCYSQGSYDEALNFHQACLNTIMDGKIKDPQFRFKTLYALANDYYYQGKLEEAINFYNQAAEQAEQLGDKANLAGIFWGLGVTYNHARQYSNAQRYLYRSALLYQELGLLGYAATVKGLIGNMLIEEGRYEPAEGALKSALELAQQQEDEVPQAVARINLAYLYYLQEKWEGGAREAEEGIRLARRQNNRVIEGQGLAQLAEIRLGEKKVEEGLGLFGEAVQVLEGTGSREHTSKVYFRYGKALEGLGNLKEAAEKYRLANEFKK